MAKRAIPFGKVAQTFQVRIDFEHGKYKAQVDGDRIIEGYNIFYITVYFEFKGVDTTFAHQYLLCQFAV